MSQRDITQQQMEHHLKSMLASIKNRGADSLMGSIPLDYHACDAIAGYITLSARTDPWMAGADGTLSHGVLSVILDEVMGLLAYLYSGGEHTPTVTMQISFLHPVPVGDRVYVRAGIRGWGKNTLSTRAELFRAGEEENAPVSAGGIYFIPSPKKG